MARGTVKRVPRVRNYAFIVYSEGGASRDVFFHRSSVEDDQFDALEPGQPVEFTLERDPRDTTRTIAVQVRPVAGGRSSSGE